MPAALAAPPAQAQSITGLTVAASPGGADQAAFAESTTGVWVRFGFSGAAATNIELTLASPSGVTMFSRREALSGSGTVEWAVSGQEVAQSLAARTTEAARTAEDYAARAATQPRGVAEFLATASFATAQMQSALRMLERLPLTGANRSDRTACALAAGDLRRLLERAAALAPGDDSGRRGYARLMAEPAGRAVAAAVALEAGVRGEGELPLPPTRSRGVERDAHTLAVRINTSPAQTRSIWLFDGRTFLPRALRGPR
jgi:hypothetical protein